MSIQSLIDPKKRARAMDALKAWNSGRKKESERLLKAVKKPDLVAAKDALEHGADANYLKGETFLEWTPLMHAAFLGHHEMINLLVRHSANLEAADWRGHTPLMEAAEKGHSGAVNALIQAGADIDAMAGYCSTPLLEAVSYGRWDAAKILIEHGADVNTGFWGCETPLIEACRNDHAETVQLLLDNGADVFVKYWTTPLNAAFGGNAGTILRWMSKTAEEEVWSNSNGLTKEPWLMKAVMARNAEIVDLLVSRGVRVDSINEWGWSPLGIASGKGYPEIAKLLVEGGADVRSPMTRNGWTPLLLSMHSLNMDEEHSETVGFLIDAGADVNAQGGPLGRSPLMMACRGGTIEMAGRLISLGADVGARDLHGTTALMLTCHRPKPEIVQLLLSNGADVNAADRFGITPLMTAAGERGQDFSEVVAMLQWNGADPNASGVQGWTALMAAAINGNAPIAQMLIDGGACLSAVDDSGRSALSMALSNRHEETAALLKKHGAKE